MSRTITAIYRSSATANLVRQELEPLGIGRHHVTILPDSDVTGRSDRTGADLDNAFDRLHDLDLPEDDTRTYQQALRNGDYVVSVSVDDGTDLAPIQDIMRRPEDAYDLDDLDTQYSAAEYTPRTSPTGLGAGTIDPQRSDRDDTVEVVEEQLSIGKREVDQGLVRVRSHAREVPVEAEVDLRTTRVYVERRPVDRALSPGEVALQDQVLEAHQHGEEAVVSKEARVVEEIGLRTETDLEHQTVHDTVRKTEVEIEDERAGERTGLTGNQTGRSRRS